MSYVRNVGKKCPCGAPAVCKGQCKKCYMRDYLRVYLPGNAHHQALKFNWRMKKQGIDITKDEYDALVKRQKGRCVICRKKPNNNLFVDHCHKTGKFRGLLCRECNWAIGHLKDSVAAAKRAVLYLKRTI